MSPRLLLLSAALPALLAACGDKVPDHTHDDPAGDGADGGGTDGSDGTTAADGSDGADGSGDGADGAGDGADGSGDGSDGGATPVDRDEDGYTNDEDCDDGDPDIHPGSEESCNGVDDDCDGATDEDPVDGRTWYADADADGFGDPDATVQACTRPSGYTGDATDCDDTLESVHPDAIEVCDGDDEDCDGLVDEDDPDTAGGVRWYTDADADGYGDAASVAVSCTQPSGTVLDDTDCDDADPTLHPAASEVCDDIDNDCDGDIDDADTDRVGGDTWYADADADGYGDPTASSQACLQPSGAVADDSDCDDTDATVSPDATEVCDSVDNDCDGLTDDDDTVTGGTTFYVDDDGDGYGGTSTVEACSQPSGTTTSADDCDDTDSAVNPGATEACDEVDNDCDGLVDDDDASPTGTTTFYLDYDADGYGGTAFTTDACELPSGYSATADDCDDSDADVSPAGTETCNGVDDDCDGLTDDDDSTVDPSGLTVYYADSDGDGYGVAGSTTTACAAPSGYADTTGDCDDSDSAVNPDAIETCNSTDDDCDGDTDEDDSDVVGASTAWPDLDGDGYGAAGSDAVYCTVPSTYVLSGGDCDDGNSDAYPGAAEICGNSVDESCSGADQTCPVGGTSGRSGDLFSAASADASWNGSGYNARLGEKVGWAGDVNADGYDDLWLGEPTGHDAFLLYGPFSGGPTDVASVGVEFTDASNTQPGIGETLNAAGDLDGDGIDDLLLGAPYQDDGSTSTVGAAYVWFGPFTATTTTDVSSADVTILGSQASALLGSLAHGGGDLDGDGDDDLVVGGWRAGSSGSAYVGSVYLFSGPVSAGSFTDADAGVHLQGVENSGYLGRSIVRGEGDLDGDGIDDLVAAAYGAGETYVLYGPVTTSGDIDTVADAILSEQNSGDAAGISHAIAPDLNGDGIDDLVVGASQWDHASGSSMGRAYVLNGPITSGQALALSTARINGTAAADYLGTRVSGMADIDGDGAGEILLAATHDDEMSSNAGAVYLLHGPVTGAFDLQTDYDHKVLGEATSDQLGSAVDGTGDADADGIPDLLVGASYAEDSTSYYQEGKAYLFDGSGL